MKLKKFLKSFRILDRQEKFYFCPCIKKSKVPGGVMFSFFGGFQKLSGDEKFDPKRFVIQRYTGFKDKKGTRIYEGDIVRYRKGVVSVVTWAESTWLLLHQVYRGHLRRDCATSLQGIFNTMKYHKHKKTTNKLHCVKVIGNIYKNADLIKEEAI